MLTLTQKQIDKLDGIGKKHNCELCLPPFKKLNNPFYHIKDIQEDALLFRDFLIAIHDSGFRHRFVMDEGTASYMEVWLDEQTFDDLQTPIMGRH